MAAGVKELLVISQDTSAYGIDTKYAEYPWRGQRRKTKFLDLCEALGELGVWVRLHYVCRIRMLMRRLTSWQLAKSCRISMPVPACEPERAQENEASCASEKTLERIQNWRKTCPDLTVRSSFIVGFPGETEDDFEYLLEWMQEAGIDRAGCFKYMKTYKARAGLVCA